YADVGCYGAKDIRTPNVDRLAREGVRMTDFYANGPVCSPTRCGFITGRWQQRAGLEWALGVTSQCLVREGPTSRAEPDFKRFGLPAAEPTIARPPRFRRGLRDLRRQRRPVLAQGPRRERRPLRRRPAGPRGGLSHRPAQ